MSQHDSVTVTDNPEQSRYEACDDSGVVAGFVDYRLRGDVITVVHTEVDQAYEGKGVAKSLVRATLEDLRDRGLAVRPRCEFFAAYIDRHPEYHDLVHQS